MERKKFIIFEIKNNEPPYKKLAVKWLNRIIKNKAIKNAQDEKIHETTFFFSLDRSDTAKYFMNSECMKQRVKVRNSFAEFT